MKDLLKYFIYEHALNVFFANVEKNLFSRLSIVKFREQYEQDVAHGVTYDQIVFAEDGFVYKFDMVHIIKLTSTHIYFEFESAFVIDVLSDDNYGEIWDKDESPFSMNIESLVETV